MSEELDRYIEQDRRRRGILPPEDGGFFGGLGKGFLKSTVNAIGGIGSTIEQLSGEYSGDAYGNRPGSGLREWRDDLLAQNQQWNEAPSGGVGEYLGNALGSAAGSTLIIAPAMVADALVGTRGVLTFSTVFAQSFGDNVQRNIAAYGPGNEDKSYGLAALESGFDALTEIALGTVPMVGKNLRGMSYAGKRAIVKEMYRQAEKELGRSGAKRFFIALGKNGLEEGAEEAIQYFNSWFWRAVGQDPGNRFDFGELADNALQGFVGGAGLGVLGGANEVATYGKARPWLPTEKAARAEMRKQGEENWKRYQKSGSGLVEAVADEMGLNVRFFDEEGAPEAKDENGNPTNAWYDEDKNEFWIDRASADADPQRFMGHEFKHFVDTNYPQLGKAFDDLLASGLTEKGAQAINDTDAAYTEAGHKGRGATEFSADTFGELWTHPETWEAYSKALEEKQMGMGERLMQALQNFIDLIRKKLKIQGDANAKELFDNLGELRNEAARIMVEIRRQNGRSTQAENVTSVNGSNTVESVKVSELNIDPKRFQFKSKANPETGVDESNQIGGKWDARTAGNLYLWEDKSGKKYVVNGHHRFALAKQNGVENVNAIIDREADGVTWQQARRNGILINIRDEQGDVADYAEFIRNEKMDEETAAKEGITARKKGAMGYAIGRYASDDLYSAFKAGDIGARKAAIIADIARGDKALENAAMRSAKSMSDAQLEAFLKILKQTPRVQNEEAETGDLFGFDDSAIKTAEAVAKQAVKKINELRETLNAAKNAIKNPAAAAKLNVKVGKEAKKLYDKLAAELERWRHYDTDPELYRQLVEEAGLAEKKEAPKAETPKKAKETPQAPKEKSATVSGTEKVDVQKVLDVYRRLRELDQLAKDADEAKREELRADGKKLLDSISVEDIKAAAAEHAKAGQKLSEEYRKASAAAEANPGDKALRKAEKEAGAALNRWAEDDNIFSQLLKLKGDNGVIVAGNYVPFAETKKEAATKKADEGRFNPDSETPLLSTEEDKNDFQLVGETAEDVKKREAAEAKAEQEAQKRKENAAKQDTGDLFGGGEQAATQSSNKFDDILANLPAALKSRVEKILALESPEKQENELSKMLARMWSGDAKNNVMKIWRSIYDTVHGERTEKAKTESPYIVTGEQGTTAYYKTKEDAEQAVKNAAALGVALRIEDNPNYKEAGATAPASGKIEDFGEKIGGARKDLAEKTGPRTKTAKKTETGPKWKNEYIINQLSDGKWTVFRDVGNGFIRRITRNTFDTEAEAKNALPAIYIADKYRFFTTNSGKFAIYKHSQSSRNFVPLKGGFETQESAMRWALQNVDELENLRGTYGEKDLATKPDYQRTGERRLDHDATAKDFSDAFGFRGVEFGNWENQRERQQLMNDAYEALYDLADLLNIPPRAISLEGQLGLAFGARGRGGSARAHYEPGYVVINLSKPKGAGSFAHEWFHALDNYFKKQQRGTTGSLDDFLSDTTRQPDNSGMRQELFEKFEAIKKAIMENDRPPNEEDLKGYRKSIEYYKDELKNGIEDLRRELVNPRENEFRKRKIPAANDEQLKKYDELTGKLLADDAPKLEWDWQVQAYVNDIYKELNDLYRSITKRSGFTKDGNGALNTLASRSHWLDRAKDRIGQRIQERTSFRDGALELDKYRSQGYWSHPWEMFARAFSAFVEDKLAAEGRKSEFLSYGSDNALYNLWKVDEADRIRAFPEGEERTRINAAFQDFFDTLKTETTPEGNTRLYSLKRVEGVNLENISGNFGKRFGNIKDALRALYKKAFIDKSRNNSFVNFADVTEDERKLLSEISGADLSEARFHGIDESGIRHLDKHHGESESRIDQEPVTEDDIEKIPDIIRGTTPEYLGVNSIGRHVFQYRKEIGNEYFYLEEYRSGRGKLSGASLWKKKDTTVAQSSAINRNGMPTPEALHPRVSASNITESSEISSPADEKSATSDLEDTVKTALKQKFGSGNTSLRQVAAGFRKIDFLPGTVNLDLGGGKFDEATEYLAKKGVTNLVFDPVNRDAEHNMRIFEAVKNGGVDTVTCNNVLNVIAEPAARDNVILQAAKALKPGGTAYFTVYEGDGTGTGRQSQADAWQENRKTADYLDEIKWHFGDVTLKNKVIIAQNPQVDGKQSAWFMDGRFEDPKVYSLKRHNQVNPIREAGAIRDEYQERIDKTYTVRPNSEVNRDAERTIERLGGMQGAINAISSGDYAPVSDTAQRVVQVVLNSDEYKALDAEQRGKIADVYIKNLGTEAGRALAARRLGALNLEDIKSIQAHVNAFMAKIDQLKPDNDLRKKILDEFDFDIDALPDEVLQDQDKLDALIRRLAAERATFGDKLYEYWINAILSGPSTHVANVFGNTANAVYELGVKRFSEALVNVVARRKDAATFGEFKAMLHAFDWRNAWRRAAMAWNYETLSLDGGKLEQVRTAIGGKTGRIIRAPGRLLRAADEFAKTLIQPIEAAAMAYREANASGLKGKELQTYIENALADDQSSANVWGRERTLELTFQEDPGNAVLQLIRWRESGGVSGKLLKFVLPFVKTPHNILKQGLRKSPLGVVNLALETGKIALGKGKFDSHYVGLLAEQLIAWGVAATLMGMGDDDDDLPFLTGSSPQYGSNEAKFKANKVPPYSIRIGGKYYSYKRIEPFATSLTLLADGIAAFRAAKRGEDGTKVMKKLMGNTWRMVAEKSFLDSLGEINRVVSDPERSLMNTATNFVAGWVPNVVRQTVGAYDDNVHDLKSRAKGGKWWEDQFMVFVDRAGIPVAAPKRDYFGREVKKDSVPGPWWISRLIPIKYVDPGENVDRAEALMMRYNHTHPEAEYYPGIPAYYFQRDGQKLYMEGKNYDEFQKRAGELAHKQINNAFRHGLLNEQKPTEKDIKLIKSIFTKARKITRDKMYLEKKFSR